MNLTVEQIIQRLHELEHELGEKGYELAHASMHFTERVVSIALSWNENGHYKRKSFEQEPREVLDEYLATFDKAWDFLCTMPKAPKPKPKTVDLIKEALKEAETGSMGPKTVQALQRALKKLEDE